MGRLGVLNARSRRAVAHGNNRPLPRMAIRWPLSPNPPSPDGGHRKCSEENANLFGAHLTPTHWRPLRVALFSVRPAGREQQQDGGSASVSGLGAPVAEGRAAGMLRPSPASAAGREARGRRHPIDGGQCVTSPLVLFAARQCGYSSSSLKAESDESRTMAIAMANAAAVAPAVNWKENASKSQHNIGPTRVSKRAAITSRISRPLGADCSSGASTMPTSFAGVPLRW